MSDVTAGLPENEGEALDETVVEEDGAAPESTPDQIREELEQKLAAQHDRLLRTAAELDNVRKRARRDVEDALARGRAEILGELLPALDSLDIALSQARTDTDSQALIQGMNLVRRQFLSSMERFGLKPIEALGRAFDPALHEAVAQHPSNEVLAGGVLEEMRRGYLLGDRLLRASMVVVSAGGAAAGKEVAAQGPGDEIVDPDGQEG